METPLYKTINHANQTKDRSVIETLGPYGCLLYYSVSDVPEDNLKKQEDVRKDPQYKERNAEGKPLLFTLTFRARKIHFTKIMLYLKVFEGDDPHELAVKFCEEHKPHRPAEFFEQHLKG